MNRTTISTLVYIWNIIASEKEKPQEKTRKKLTLLLLLQNSPDGTPKDSKRLKRLNLNHFLIYFNFRIINFQSYFQKLRPRQAHKVY